MPKERGGVKGKPRTTGAGKPAHVPTEETRRTVEAMTAYGIPQDEIIKVIGIRHKETLHKYYRDEIDTSAAKATAKIAGVLFKKAMAGDTASCIFWLKSRAGWREIIRNEHTGADGQPMYIQIVDDIKS